MISYWCAQKNISFEIIDYLLVAYLFSYETIKLICNMFKQKTLNLKMFEHVTQGGGMAWC